MLHAFYLLFSVLKKYDQSFKQFAHSRMRRCTARADSPFGVRNYLHPWKVTGPELKCLHRSSVEKTLASEDKILYSMAFDFIYSF